MDDHLPMIAAAGLDFEAQAARGLGIKVVRGLNRRKYLSELYEEARAGARGLISFGIAGGLSPNLKSGDVIVASSVKTERTTYNTCTEWSAALLAAIPHARYLPVFGATGPVLTPAEKAALWRKTGSATVDVESRDAAEVATHYGLPYAVLRVVLDPAERAIPLTALCGADEDGKTCVKAVLKAVARRPRDIPGLVRIANDGRKANRALFETRQALGPFFSFYSGKGQAPCPDYEKTGLAQAVSYSAQIRAAADYFVFIRTLLARRSS